MSSALREPAHYFFALLNLMYRVEAEQRLEWIAIISAPHMQKGDSEKLMNMYRKQSRDIMELLEDNDDYSGIEKLKKEM